MITEKEKPFIEDTSVPMDKYDLRVTRLFWATIGFILGVGMSLIIFIQKCEFSFFS